MPGGRPKGSKNRRTVEAEALEKIDLAIKHNPTYKELSDDQLMTGFKILENEAQLAVVRAEQAARGLEKRGIKVESKARKAARIIDVDNVQVHAQVKVQCPHPPKQIKALKKEMKVMKEILLELSEIIMQFQQHPTTPEEPVDLTL